MNDQWTGHVLVSQIISFPFRFTNNNLGTLSQLFCLVTHCKNAFKCSNTFHYEYGKHHKQKLTETFPEVIATVMQLLLSTDLCRIPYGAMNLHCI